METWSSELVGIVFGYLFAIIIGHLAVSRVYKAIWENTGWIEKKENQRFVYAPALVGLVERALYVAAAQLNSPEFIAVWLAIKVAGQWKTWEEGADTEDGPIRGQVFFNFFLVGTGFSIAYALVGFTLISSIKREDYMTAILFPTVLIAGTIGFVIQTKRYKEKYAPKHNTGE